MPKQYFVYILSNKRNGTLYTGSTSELLKRVQEHKSCIVPDSFTAKYHVNKLVYYEEHSDAESMVLRERRLKEWNRTWKVRLINELNPEWNDLSENFKD